MEEVILEEDRNLLLLKSNPELHINRVSKDTSISSIKFEYQTPFPDEKTVSVIITFSNERRSSQLGY
mgnify:CR=1 FL=1